MLSALGLKNHKLLRPEWALYLCSDRAIKEGRFLQSLATVGGFGSPEGRLSTLPLRALGLASLGGSVPPTRVAVTEFGATGLEQRSANGPATPYRVPGQTRA